MPLLDLTCRHCGAKLTDIPGRDRFFCPFCGALFEKEKSVVQNITNIACNSVQLHTADFEIRSGTLLKYNGSSPDVTIPDTVFSIGPKAFMGSSVRIVKVPSSVQTIGAYAFADCTSLESIELPDSLTEIGNRAFFRCSLLKNVNIPSHAKYSYGDAYPFLGTPMMTEIDRELAKDADLELRNYRIAHNICPECGLALIFKKCRRCGYRKV